MTVDQNGAAARSLVVMRPNHRMPRSGTNFGGQTDLGQFFHQPIPALSYFFRVLIVGRDAGEPEELIKIFEMTCAHGWTVATQKRLSSQGASPARAVALCGEDPQLVALYLNLCVQCNDYREVLRIRSG